MTDEEIAVRLEGDKKEIGSLKHRMDECEEQQKTMNLLVSSVDKLAVNMEHMLTELKEQGQRLLKLEQAPADDYRHYKRLATGCVITTIIGIIIGAVFALIIK